MTPTANRFPFDLDKLDMTLQLEVLCRLALEEARVALSITEAEYISMANVAQAILFVRDVLEFKTRSVIEKPTIVKADNQAALCIVEKPSTVHGRSKHIRVRYHFVRDLVAEKFIKFEWTSSETNAADVFTKPLGRIAFERCVGRIMVSGGDDDNQ